MTSATTQFDWKQQQYNLRDKFFVSETKKLQDPNTNEEKLYVVGQKSKILNQKVDYDLFNTIKDYGKTGCAKLLHQIWQVVRFIFTFGNTQWTSTRNELIKVVKEDLKPIVAADLPDAVKVKIKDMIDEYPFQQRDTEEKVEALRADLTAKVVNEIIKKFDIKNAVNTLMLALLKVEKAGKVVELSTKDTGLTKEETLAKSIFEKHIEQRLTGIVNFLEPDATKQAAFRINSNNFEGSLSLVDYIKTNLLAAQNKLKEKLNV